MRRQEMWSFQTANFRVVATIELDEDFDSSWCDSEDLEKIESGEYTVFGTVVTVYFRGAEVGSDSLWGSVYSDPAEFFNAHRDSNPDNRNTSLRPGRVICHYFPSMVVEAIREARKTLSNVPQLRSAN